MHVLSKKLSVPTMHGRRTHFGSIHESLLSISLIILVVLVVVQFTLILRVRLTLEFAAHEAARIGALNSGSPVALPIDITKLGLRGKKLLFADMGKNAFSSINKGSVWDGLVGGMLPLYSSSKNTKEGLIERYAKAQVDLMSSTCIEYLNPTQQSFLDWGFIENSGENRYIFQIPNDSLRYRKPTAYDLGQNPTDDMLKGNVSKKSLAESNVLHLRVNYGYKLTIPFVNDLLINGYKLIVGNLTELDTFDKNMLAAGKLPLRSEGTVGMQSPLHWHPFYMFSPSLPAEPPIVPDVGFDFSPGTDTQNITAPIDYINAIRAFIYIGFENLRDAGVNGVLTLNKKSGNGIAFCPANWFDKEIITNPFE